MRDWDRDETESVLPFDNHSIDGDHSDDENDRDWLIVPEARSVPFQPSSASTKRPNKAPSVILPGSSAAVVVVEGTAVEPAFQTFRKVALPFAETVVAIAGLFANIASGLIVHTLQSINEDGLIK